MKFLFKFIYQIPRMVWLWLKPLPMGVRVLLVRDHQVYLVKHVYEDYWYIPGGTVERGERLDQTARREALEEAGARLNDLALFGAYSHIEVGKSSHIVVFISHDFTFESESDHEIESAGFYPLDQLPEGMSPGSQHRIEEYRQGKSATLGAW